MSLSLGEPIGFSKALLTSGSSVKSTETSLGSRTPRTTSSLTLTSWDLSPILKVDYIIPASATAFETAGPTLGSNAAGII